MDICNSRWTLEEWLFRSFKSLKNGIKIAVEKKNLLFSELQTVSFEAGNLVNERPIRRHPTTPEDGAYLRPNYLLPGRAS